jgi:hypothetical protein
MEKLNVGLLQNAGQNRMLHAEKNENLPKWRIGKYGAIDIRAPPGGGIYSAGVP